MNAEVKHYIEKELNKKLSIEGFGLWQLVGGGSINTTYKLSFSNTAFFVKINTIDVFKNGFREEVKGIEFLKQHKVQTPSIIFSGKLREAIFLVLNWIDEGDRTTSFWENLAQQLAKLHSGKNVKFGLSHTNYMGSLPQKNTFCTNFSQFFIENRLQPQLQIAKDKGILPVDIALKFERLFKNLSEIFPTEKPAALHGDLWSGNFMCNKNRQAVFIDPAVYYGHREVDLSMSTLFGGFSEKFYNTYQEIYPLEPGFAKRKDIYNLYPLLIHLNLFGTSYLGSIKRILLPF